MPTLSRRVGRSLAVAVPSLAGATLVAGLLETYLQIPNASVVYLTAVVATAIVGGTSPAILTALASFVLYDFFFTEPRLTFVIQHPDEWLSLLLLLFVGIVVGELAALERSRAETAEAREREARVLFRLTRDLVTRTTTAEVLPVIAATLAAETGMERVWITFGDEVSERVVADTSSGPRPTNSARHAVLRRFPGDQPAQWVRLAAHSTRTLGHEPLEAYRVRVEQGGARLGSVWGTRRREAGEPDRTETRLLAAAADQIGQALAQDRLVADAQAAEIARQSDTLKSALLQSVSHDLRTPLATIRTAAGTLRPGSGLSDADRTENVAAIDREVEYLNRLVTNLLELSRIEAGALKPEIEVFELEDVVGGTVERLRSRLRGHQLRVALAAPPVRADPVLLDDVVTNILENSIKYTPPDCPIALTASTGATSDEIRLTIEDGGPGVPAESLPKLFDRFYRVPGRRGGSRSGTGIGLAVVRGLMESTGGRAEARASELGGLAIDLYLPCTNVPAAAGEEAE